MTALVLEEATLAAMESEHFIVFTPCASPYITAPSSVACTPDNSEQRVKMKQLMGSIHKDEDFAFFSGNVSSRLVSAEELFDSGVIRPLKPKNMEGEAGGVADLERLSGSGGRRRSGLCPLVMCEGWKPLKVLLHFGRQEGRVVGREEEEGRRQKGGEREGGRGRRRGGRRGIMMGCSRQQGFLKRFWFNQSGLVKGVVKNVSPLPSRG